MKLFRVIPLLISINVIAMNEQVPKQSKNELMTESQETKSDYSIISENERFVTLYNARTYQYRVIERSTGNIMPEMKSLPPERIQFFRDELNENEDCCHCILQ